MTQAKNSKITPESLATTKRTKSWGNPPRMQTVSRIADTLPNDPKIRMAFLPTSEANSSRQDPVNKQTRLWGPP